MSGERPFVSVIVPVYNDPDGIRRCLTALTEQTYPDDRYEVLAVDNGSTDNTPEVIREFEGVELLVEDGIQGSYAARNRGIEAATGGIFAFTDADCTPDPGWIVAGVETLDRENADLIGGRVVFEFSEEKTAAERFDASVNMRNDQSVQDGVAKTANVIVRRAVVEDIGPFPQHLPSGGDVHWTGAATDAGYRLMYGADVIVRHPSRQFTELLRKQYRVGKGQIQIWRLDDRSAVLILLGGLLRFPMKVVGFLVNSTDNQEAAPTPEDRDSERDIAVTLVAACCVIAMTAGRVVGLFK